MVQRVDEAIKRASDHSTLSASNSKLISVQSHAAFGGAFPFVCIFPSPWALKRGKLISTRLTQFRSSTSSPTSLNGTRWGFDACPSYSSLR